MQQIEPIDKVVASYPEIQTGDDIFAVLVLISI